MFRCLTSLIYDLQLIRKKMVKSAKESIKQKVANPEIYSNMQAVFIKMDNTQPVSCLVIPLD